MIAPNFVNRAGGVKSNLWTRFLSLIGVNFEHRWTEDEYAKFIEDNGWKIEYRGIIDTRIPIVYLECRP